MGGFRVDPCRAGGLGWIVSGAFGKAVTELLSARLWQRKGAEQDGHPAEEGKGTPIAGGGLRAGLRDLELSGLLMLNWGSTNGGRQLATRVRGAGGKTLIRLSRKAER